MTDGAKLLEEDIEAKAKKLFYEIQSGMHRDSTGFIHLPSWMKEWAEKRYTLSATTHRKSVD